jgi:hypothetical protein
MTAARRSVRFLVSTRRRRARSTATVFDPKPPFAQASSCNTRHHNFLTRFGPLAGWKQLADTMPCGAAIDEVGAIGEARIASCEQMCTMKAMIQFRRYVPLAAERGARVILKVLKRCAS